MTTTITSVTFRDGRFRLWVHLPDDSTFYTSLPEAEVQCLMDSCRDALARRASVEAAPTVEEIRGELTV